MDADNPFRVKGECDECGLPASRWLGDTAVRVCNELACWIAQTEKYRSALKEADDMQRITDGR